jgi:hypothetical protein
LECFAPLLEGGDASRDSHPSVRSREVGTAQPVSPEPCPNGVLSRERPRRKGRRKRDSGTHSTQHVDTRSYSLKSSTIQREGQLVGVRCAWEHPQGAPHSTEDCICECTRAARAGTWCISTGRTWCIRTATTWCISARSAWGSARATCRRRCAACLRAAPP